ncbi:hypothetical protein DPMN_048714 [Dreissena polymorpha]|uniref:Uncharacterized protein n=1 Tax=Dreissena polymorpha TaxID=45954 RepID=A0A9D4I2L0_DREPO|nr:hypothetical protein DPMN_048615 [Dreissena polymorpha]KAH3741984.1 hypothetical protein DPMN_048714 [Dreissena polymorpha]
MLSGTGIEPVQAEPTKKLRYHFDPSWLSRFRFKALGGHHCRIGIRERVESSFNYQTLLTVLFSLFICSFITHRVIVKVDFSEVTTYLATYHVDVEKIHCNN